jgi:hypothetical protein
MLRHDDSIMGFKNYDVSTRTGFIYFMTVNSLVKTVMNLGVP